MIRMSSEENLNSNAIETRAVINDCASEIRTLARSQLLSSNTSENRVKCATQVQILDIRGNTSIDTDSAISTESMRDRGIFIDTFFVEEIKSYKKDHHSVDRTVKQKSKCYWNTRRRKTEDSETESTPLLSSASHTSAEPVMFYESETSDIDSSFTGSFTRYGGVTPASSSAAAVTTQSSRLSTKIHRKSDTNSLEGLNNHQYYNDNETKILSMGKPIDETSLPPLLDVLPKQNSLVTIFSIWNTILGSSLLTMPWGILMAGLIPGIALILIMSGLCLFTAYRILQVHKYHGGFERTEVPELCRIFLGPFAGVSAKLFSVTVMVGANIAYWILMSNCLYHSVNFIYAKVSGYDMYPHFVNSTELPEVLCPKEIPFNSTQVISENSFDNLGPMWDLYKTVPFFLGLIMFPLLNFNSTTFFTKFNSLGTAAIGYLIFIVVIKSSKWGINMDEFTWKTSWKLKSTFPALCGMLALSFFIHNIIITIMQHNKNQNNNGRDLSIAYFLVTLTYIIVGLAFYLSFPLAKSCIEDNLLNNFQKWDVLIAGARIVLFFQLLTVYPLITYMLRICVLTTLFQNQNCSRISVVIMNLIVVGICMLFARYLPYVGTVIRYTGAISGLVYVFTLPSLLHLVILYRKGEANVSSVILNLSIPAIGFANLVAQLFVSAH